ncbi:pilus assembly protein CpaC [Brevundimonas sp. S30B]|uniref:pilus assembly protein N-terminal domain-containing protein n=1 Tax=unclassified Brevundimonas TaxID=2622653 RepID=UPI001072B3BB|nr:MULTISPECIES: pilus assembly protein N-terminal domain-containing protein [unclassified Brevundimonas]QBX37295.1 pilus assembly protein CpaC [Brevundimonas sp. MF30-B]TFW03912.1 pilus assembly protein CpaC [Brevundimonas sp. S30B]
MKIVTLLTAALVLAGAMATSATSQSSGVHVEIDRSTRVSLRAPAASVIVGNPAIADVTVVDANTLFITGKGYGVTEVVAVDPIGRTVFQSPIVVTAGANNAVRVWRGGRATEMACAGSSCAPSVRAGGGVGSEAP